MVLKRSTNPFPFHNTQLRVDLATGRVLLHEEYDTPTGYRDLLHSTGVLPGTDHFYDAQYSHISGGNSSRHEIEGGTTKVDAELCHASLYANPGITLPGVSFGGRDAARVAAITNPTRSKVAVPVFIAELRDLPEMIHHAGTLLLPKNFGKALVGHNGKPLSPTQAAASSYLAYNFGWKPMVQDLYKMITFKDSVDKRMKEFDKLYNSKGLRRRVKLDTEELHSSRTLFDTWGLNGFPTRQTGVGISKYTGVIRWKPAAPSPFSRRPTPIEVRRMILQLSADKITSSVWEALPWSWLCDWFGNVGDVIKATEGRLVAEHGGINLFCNQEYNGSTESISYHSPTFNVTYNGATISGGYHLRQPGSVTFAATLPLLGMGQLSTLGSLAVTRSRLAQ